MQAPAFEGSDATAAANTSAIAGETFDMQRW
jgi:hypothetical protein